MKDFVKLMQINVVIIENPKPTTSRFFEAHDNERREERVDARVRQLSLKTSVTHGVDKAD